MTDAADDLLIDSAISELRAAFGDHPFLARHDVDAPPSAETSEQVWARTDLTLLKPEASGADIDALCAKAVAKGAKTVCVNSSRVARAAAALDGSSTAAICVVGFPLGASDPSACAAEAGLAIDAGAAEIDMVVPVGRLLEDDFHGVLEAIATVADLCGRTPLKVILETCLLDDRHVVLGCLLAGVAGADFVKTSTGFSTGGATTRHVALMRRTVGSRMQVKASGGIRDVAAAMEMIRAGADRIGASRLDDVPAGGAGY